MLYCKEGIQSKEKGTRMKLYNGDFPKNILLSVPKGKAWTIGGQIFSTDDLPKKLLATFVSLEDVKLAWRKVTLVKYSVEPIFSMQIAIRQDGYGNEYYDVESINRICGLISQPGMKIVRSAIPQDEFVEQRTDEKPYWLYNPDDKYHAKFVEKGMVWTTSILGCDFGYYYECYSSKNGNVIRKVGDRSLLLEEPRAVKPVVFFDAKAFVKARKMNLAFA